MDYTALMQPNTDIKEYMTPYSMQSIKVDMLPSVKHNVLCRPIQRVELTDSTCCV